VTIEDKALLANGYDEAAADFARSADPLVFRALARPLVDAVVAELGSDPGPVLDVAAGAGAFGRRFPQVVALDLAAGQLAHNPAGRRVQADAEHLPFRDCSFSAVGCAFGINHVPDAGRVVEEMARVAPVVALSTWARPEVAYEPKRIVHAALERQVGRGRTPAGELLDRLSDEVGSVGAMADLLRGAGLDPVVRAVEAELAWPGVDAYLDYRLSMPSTATPADLVALRAEVASAIAPLSSARLVWRPVVVIGLGRH
jgi:SAM-dependent methyltransferase